MKMKENFDGSEITGIQENPQHPKKKTGKN